MDLYQDIELNDCPVCHGPATIEEENGWAIYVTCQDCGCHTAYASFCDEKEKKEAAEKVALLWNIGKVLSHNPGE